MQSYISRRVLILWCVIMLGGLFFPNILLGALDITVDTSENHEFFTLQCTIMEVHPKGRYLIVGEQRIELIDFLKGDSRYRTMLRDSKGKAIPFSSLQEGQWVFIRGFKLSEGRIAAREIYLLSQAVKTRKDFRRYHFFEQVPVWKPVR